MQSRTNPSFKKLQLVIICPVIVLVAVLLVALPEGAQTTQIKVTTIPYTTPNSGSEMYAHYCASCHGVTGQGNGPAAAGLKERPADLTQLSRTHGGKYPEMLVYTTLHDGPNAAGHEKVKMPVWNDLFVNLDGIRSDVPQMRLTSLTEYVRTLQAK